MQAFLLLLGSLKFGKLLLTSGSMLVSVFAYALIFGWPYAVGFVALIFVHEMGHYLAARQRGLNVGAPTFIPFVGAWIQLKELPPQITRVQTRLFGISRIHKNTSMSYLACLQKMKVKHRIKRTGKFQPQRLRHDVTSLTYTVVHP